MNIADYLQTWKNIREVEQDPELVKFLFKEWLGWQQAEAALKGLYEGGENESQ